MLHFIASLSHKLNQLIKLLPDKLAVKLYSIGRSYFMNKFYHEQIITYQTSHLKNTSRTLWGIDFRYPLCNAAGMFKNGEGYDIVAKQGAGAYIGGTSTVNPRIGNIKHGVKHPFITLPESECSVNFLGLPNLGDGILSKTIITQNRIIGCPIGWSLMKSPDYPETEALELLVKSLFKYQANLQIDFIEINESCPNVGVDFNNLELRLQYLAQNFLAKRERHLPVIIKLSNNVSIENLLKFLDILFKYRFDGVNVGNTSTNYANIAQQLDVSDKDLFKYFTDNFGGGVGGKPLKASSLELCRSAVDYRNQIKPDYEFHVIRTGGINSYSDIIQSDAAGISLNQWYTGYFSNYIKHGNQLYKNLNGG